jgi:formylglycine-generating enzyme required for sulfatase activity
MNRMLKVLITTGLFTGYSSAEPMLLDAALNQLKGTRIVEVTYRLTGADPAIITLDIETNGVALPPLSMKHLSGDVSKTMTSSITPDDNEFKTIRWDAGQDWPGQLTTDAVAKVTAYYTNTPPVYLVVDLSKGTNASVFPVRRTCQMPNVDDDACRTTELWLRYVPAGTFTMGDLTSNAVDAAEHAVTLTQDYYIGVFEITQYQWYQVRGTKPDAYYNVQCWATRPLGNISYTDVRGTWPTSGYPTDEHIATNSFLGVLRAKTGMATFDLPTDAQWERACIGALGCGYTWNDGSERTEANLARLARCWLNSAGTTDYTVGNTYGTAKVGSYVPNTLGLYDMHGNMNEFCRDRYLSPLGQSPVTDPLGSVNSTAILYRGAGANDAIIGNFYATARLTQSSITFMNPRLGFRIISAVR